MTKSDPVDEEAMENDAPNAADSQSDEPVAHEAPDAADSTGETGEPPTRRPRPWRSGNSFNRLELGIQIRSREPRDWSDYVKGYGADFLERCTEFMSGYTDRKDVWRYAIADLQGWRCYYGGASVLRTFAPVVHLGIPCDANTFAPGGCSEFGHHRVACMHHASARGMRSDQTFVEAMKEDSELGRCCPDPLLPNGHGWCGTGIRPGEWHRFNDPSYQPGGWGDRFKDVEWWPIADVEAHSERTFPTAWYVPAGGVDWRGRPPVSRTAGEETA